MKTSMASALCVIVPSFNAYAADPGAKAGAPTHGVSAPAGARDAAMGR